MPPESRIVFMLALRSSIGVPLAASLMLLACSKTSPPAPAPTAATPAVPAMSAEQAQSLKKSVDMYRQLVLSKSYELAAPIGQEVVAKYPSSTEAKEIQQTLADTTAKASAISTRRRLERLWIYQSGKESGGEQSTASIYSSEPATTDRVRLVLRKHSAWGQSVYLFGSGKGFECGKPCTVSIRYDDTPPQRTKAHLPE